MDLQQPVGGVEQRRLVRLGLTRLRVHHDVPVLRQQVLLAHDRPHEPFEGIEFLDFKLPVTVKLFTQLVVGFLERAQDLAGDGGG